MVSTRGPKYKFFEGERVLCYEPDPTKAKVLYDSKVLEIVVNKDPRGKKTVEYLIHFQGWNSSWDRCVAEEYVLKDTPENRQLQKDLAEKAQLQLGAYLYRKERKKHSRKISDRTEPSSEDGSSGSPTRIDTDDNRDMTSSEEDSSIEDESIEIELTPDLRQILENDYYLMNKKNRLMRLPTEPNVVTILETYYHQYATNQICGLNEKPKYRNLLNNHIKSKPEDIQNNLTICREVMDGLRIYFDSTLNDILLYGAEKGQFITKMALAKPPGSSDVKPEIKNEEDVLTNNTNNSNHTEGHYTHNGNAQVTARRRTLRSSYKHEQTNGVSSGDENNEVINSSMQKPASSVSSNHSDKTGPLGKELCWKMLPDHVYSQKPPPPCLVYGATHLTRLFVKLPELLIASSIPESRLKVLLRHLDMVIDFLSDHKEWYGEKYYLEEN